MPISELRICEARCPRCLTYEGYVIPLNYDQSSRVFTCQRDTSHCYVQDENGFLVSRR